MTLTIRADCPSCGGEFRVPLIAELTSSSRCALTFDIQALKDLFDEHCAEAPEKHGGGA